MSTLAATDRALLAALEDGLALCPRPYAALAERLGTSEEAVIADLRRLIAEGVISRFGVVVRHHELGYRANAMVVWAVPADEIAQHARALVALPYVTLCYRRRPALPAWPYTLYCMIHGRDRERVEAQIEEASQRAGLHRFRRAVLFSRRRFTQRGARYGGCR